ncbi:hypothetical protein QF037_009114 [Streptomyces canus]|nr:hypothetical protein [Streptomyces canus]
MPVQSTASTGECNCLAHGFGNAADNRLRERRYPSDITASAYGAERRNAAASALDSNRQSRENSTRSTPTGCERPAARIARLLCTVQT